MKKLLITLILLISISAFAQSNCTVPSGEYTPIENVLNQFVLDNGNPNWGDWCYDSGYDLEKEKACTKELNLWGEWLKCAGLLK